MADDPFPQEWQDQIIRAYTVFGVDPFDHLDMDGADEFGLFGGFKKLSKQFLSEKAKEQLRDVKGMFREMRGRLSQDKGRDRISLPDAPRKIEPVSVPSVPRRVEPVSAPDIDPFMAPPETVPIYKQPVEQRVRQALWPKGTNPAESPPSAATLPRGASLKDLGYQTGRLSERAGSNAEKMREEVVQQVIKSYTEYKKDAQKKGIDPWTVEYYITTAADKVREKLLSEDGVHLRRKLRRIGDLDEGSRNQFETQTSGGALAPDLRRKMEHDVLGVPFDQPDHLRPVYGYKGPAAGGYEKIGSEQYGDVALTLKDGALGRVTVTPGDSLDTHAANALLLKDLQDGADISPGDVLATLGPATRQHQLSEIVDRGMKDYSLSSWGELNFPSSYMEAQIHGGLPLEDVAKITIDAMSARRAGRNASYEDTNAFSDIKTFVDDLGSPLPPERAFEVSLQSMGLMMEDFGEPGSPLRDLAENVQDEVVELYNDGRIYSVIQAPGMAELLKQYYASKGYDLEVAIEAEPPLGADDPLAHRKREKELEEDEEFRIMTDIGSLEWYQDNGQPIPDRLQYLLAMPSTEWKKWKRKYDDVQSGWAPGMGLVEGGGV
jgi:hypothetical protein